MFRNRTSSQKPGNELYENFRQHFPQIASATSSSGSNSGNTSLDATQNAAGATVDKQQNLAPGEMKDLDPTPRAQHQEPWRFTPSLLDPNSYAFHSFANQPPGYYTPTPGGSNTLYHNQAGDLHTPGMGMGMGLGTPLSLPQLEGGVHAGSMMEMPGFTHMQPQLFQNYNPFGPPQPHQQQSSFAPSSFLHQDTGYETMEQDGSPLGDGRMDSMDSMDSTMHHQSPLIHYQPRYDSGFVPSVPASAEKFRFHVTLNAPTAMIKSADEIPVTYLNKGQAYSVSIIDTLPTMPASAGTRYRTFVRISFEDEQQRQKPATCWQLWKEGRGTNEAHQRGGKLQAVEYVESNQPAESDDKRTRVDLDTASFDGFSVLWTPGANGSNECNIAVRFNFLSTDFSHSKGVKGIPVRLCAKTEMIGTGSPRANSEAAEVAFCKVKLFRDHGAERKLSNDVAHVKKTIDKLKQQITQAETGMKDFKRKRNSIISKPQPAQRPGKVQKHKRTWSMSSTSSAGGRVAMEEDLHYKLQTMQDMFTSTRPVSVLYLRGTEQDDPDLHPVALSGEPLDLTKVDSKDVTAWQQRASERGSTTGNSSMVSPTPSSVSIRSQGIVGAAPGNNAQWGPVKRTASADIQSSNPQQLASPPDQLTRVARKSTGDSVNLSGWIEALGVDSGYQPPAERSNKPVACFYVLRRDPSSSEKHEYHRAIYLTQRTLQDFNSAIASKWGLDVSRIQHTLHVLPSGLRIEVDDDVVRELAEGQDFVLEVATVAAPIKHEWEMTDVPVDSNTGAAAQSNDIESPGYELRLIF